MSADEPVRPPLWLPDTSSLISLAVDDALRAAVQAELSSHRLALLDVVVDELHDLAKPGGPVSALSSAALSQLSWLGPTVDTVPLADVGRVAQIQDAIRGTRPLKHHREHWAESVILDIASRLTAVSPILLSEDYDARVEARYYQVDPYSTHKLLSRMVRAGRLGAEEAATFADELKRAGRGPDCAAGEFESGRLGRVGQP